MRTIPDIIDELGGTSKVAAALYLTPSTVSSWKIAGRVPRWRRPSLIELAGQIGASLSEADFAAKGEEAKSRRKRTAA